MSQVLKEYAFVCPMIDFESDERTLNFRYIPCEEEPSEFYAVFVWNPNNAVWEKQAEFDDLEEAQKCAKTHNEEQNKKFSKVI